MDANWAQLSPEEKREQRFNWWLNPVGVKFSSPQAEKQYRQKAQRFIDVYSVREPDRVPVSINLGATPAYLAGADLHTVMYDYEKLKTAWKKFNTDFDLDSVAGPSMVLPGRVYDLLDYRLYSWPGHGLPLSATGIQFVEGEYMQPGEYDDLIRNPSDFWQRIYMPRVFGSLESYRLLQPFTNIIELPAAHFIPYSYPEIQASLLKLIEIGNEMARYLVTIGDFNKWALESGHLIARSVMAKAPFDTLGDTLRGTRGIITDMYRQPDKLLEAIGVITDITINQTLTAASASRAVTVMFPLHKGADGFMSQKQFEKFYWPSLKKVILALIEEGLIPVLFAEGSFDTRLESVNEFPKGAVAWLFDKTDMARAKSVLGSKCCISGNIPTSVLITGTPQELKDYCRKLIETCGQGGGYILASGASIDNGNPDNIRAVLEAAREYGTY